MTKDYEAVSIADETRRDVERRMQSPYTRAEFVAQELAAQGGGSPGSLNADRAEWNAQAAERAGITWRQEAAADKPLVDWLADRVDDLEVSYKAQTERIASLGRRENLCVQVIVERLSNLEKDLCGLSVATRRSDDDLAGRISTLERLSSALSDRVLGDCEIDDNDEYTPVLDRLDGLAGRMSTANARITAIEKAVRGLEQQVARPIVAEIRDPTGAQTVYHAIEERAKDEIRMLIREEIGHLADQIHQRVEEVVEEVIQPACETIGDHDRRLSLQLERITELANGVHSLFETVEVIRQRLYYGNAEDSVECGLIEQVRRLDADMALVRDAVCPPQGAPPIEPVGDPAYQAAVAAGAQKMMREIGRAWAVEDGSLNGPAPVETEAAYKQGCQCRACTAARARENQTPSAVDWPDPTPTMLESPVFEAIWQAIKSWDIAVPGAYSGYTSATGNHVRAVLDAMPSNSFATIIGHRTEHLRQTRDALRAACLELGADATWSDDINLNYVVYQVLLPHVRSLITTPKPPVQEMQDAIRGFSGPEIWSAMGTSRQVEVPVRERVLGVPPYTLWNALEMHAQASLLDYLWRNHWGELGSAASKHGIRCSYRGT